LCLVVFAVFAVFAVSAVLAGVQPCVEARRKFSQGRCMSVTAQWGRRYSAWPVFVAA